MAGCVKHRQGHRAARGQGTSRILYFVHTVLSACGSCPTTPGAPQSCGVAVQWGSNAMGQQAHTVTPQLGREAGEVGGSPQGARGSELATPQIPPSPSSSSSCPSYPPTPWAPCQLGQWDAGPAVGQGEGSDHDPQAAPTPQDPSSPPRPSCPWDKVHMKPGWRLGGKQGHRAAVPPGLAAAAASLLPMVPCSSLQVAIGLEAVVARVSHDNVAVGGECQPLWPVQRVSRRVDVGQERARAVKYLQEGHKDGPDGPSAQGHPALTASGLQKTLPVGGCGQDPP